MVDQEQVKAVMNTIKQKDVKFIRIWFTDLLGRAKAFAITPEELDEAFSEGLGIDGSSILGFTDIERSDMVVYPDPGTFQILPWRPTEAAVARMFCDIVNPDGTPFAGDPRYILKRAVKKAADKGYKAYFGPELEYFYFKNDKCTEPLDQGGYFDLTTRDAATNLRRDTILALTSMGMRIEHSHHEVAPSQHEIDMRYMESVKMADAATTLRIVVKEIANKHGVYATFMPKPMYGVNGSGMHCHQSLFTGDKNAFFDPKNEYSLSETAFSYMGGLMKYAPEFCLVTNPLVNSYKRLVPGYEAPCYIAWAQRNRSAMIRVPMYKPGKEKATRFELRMPDPSCNVYLAFAVMLQAGLKGIEQKLKCPPPVEKNIFHMSCEDRTGEGIGSVPGSLGEAIAAASKSSFLKEALGEHAYSKLLEVKTAEWDKYRIQVTDWELDNYLPIY
jgi:glutamine synthetase